jgi:hypothetical protein
VKFSIEYTDPETNERKSVVRSFEDSASISAKEWALDLAYSLANKNTDYIVKELKGN